MPHIPAVHADVKSVQSVQLQATMQLQVGVVTHPLLLSGVLVLSIIIDTSYQRPMHLAQLLCKCSVDAAGSLYALSHLQTSTPVILRWTDHVFLIRSLLLQAYRLDLPVQDACDGIVTTTSQQ